MPPEQREELKPCPFCGSPAHIDEQPPHSHTGPLASFMPDYRGSFTVECMGAGCNTGQIADTRAEAVAMWNRRAQVEALTVPQWISVEDRLPDEDSEVIALYWPYNNRANQQIAELAHYLTGSVFLGLDGDEMHPPSHWMPFAYPTIPAIPGTKEGA